MYRKTSRNSAAMIVGSTSNCGVRRNCRSVRRAVCPVAVMNPAPRACDGAMSAVAGAATVEVVVVVVIENSMRSGRVGGRLGIAVGVRRRGRRSGEGEEHLVE